MALFSRCLEPVGFLESLRSLALGVVSHLKGTANPEELTVYQELQQLEQELVAGPGLLEDEEMGTCEDYIASALGELYSSDKRYINIIAIAIAFGQLCLAVQAGGPQTPRETEFFLQSCSRDKLERRLLSLWRCVQGSAVVALRHPLLAQAVELHQPRRPQMAQLCQKLNAVLGAGLLCLLSEAGLTQCEPGLLLGIWSERMGALHQRMKEALVQCAHYFRQQAKEDMEQTLSQVVLPGPTELAAGLLQILEKNYDWLCWTVMAWQGKAEAQEVLAQGSFLADQSPARLQLVACYSERPTTIDRARIHQLIGELEWKLPNPPPEIYASLEAEPSRACDYLAHRMLQKLAKGLGPSVTLLVVPSKLEMKSGFPRDTSLIHKYHHHLASGTVCIFG